MVQPSGDSGVGQLHSLPVTTTASGVNLPQVAGTANQPGPAVPMSVVRSDTHPLKPPVRSLILNYKKS